MKKLLYIVLLSLLLIAVASVSATVYTGGLYVVDDETVTTTVEVSGYDLPIEDINVTIDFHKHSDNVCDGLDAYDAYDEEIAFVLQSPSGTQVNLVYNDDSPDGPTYGSDILTAGRTVVTFDDEAATKVGGPVVVAGTFQPEEPLSTFDGEDANGTWTLIATDSDSGDPLCIYSWFIDLGGFRDGRINKDNAASYVIFADGSGGLVFYAPQGGEVLIVSAAEIDAVPAQPETNTLIASSDAVSLYRLTNGEFQAVGATLDGTKNYVVRFSEAAADSGYISYEE